MNTQIFVRSPGSARVEDPQWRGHWAWRGILGLLLAVTIAGCSQDPKQTLITQENQAELYQTISKGNALTYEEAQLLEAYLERNREELEDHKLPPGRTIEELIEEQRLLAILDQSNSEEGDTPAQDPKAFQSGGKGSQPKVGKGGSPPGSSPPNDKSGGENLTSSSGKDKSVPSEPKVVEPPAPTTAVVPSGTALKVRLNESLSSKSNQAGDFFETVLEEDLIVDGHLLASEGSRITGMVKDAEKSGKVKGRARMSLALTEIAVGDETYDVDSNTLKFEAKSTAKRDAKRTGLVTGAGALIGVLTGGKKGAGIGAIIGAGVGGGATVLTAGDEVEFAVEQLFEFKLDDEVEMKIVSK